jgi:hypothetical protein
MGSPADCCSKIDHIFRKSGRKTATFSKKVVENLPPEPQKGIEIVRQPKDMVEKQPPLPLGVVENLPLVHFLFQESHLGVEIEAAF